MTRIRSTLCSPPLNPPASRHVTFWEAHTKILFRKAANKKTKMKASCSTLFSEAARHSCSIEIGTVCWTSLKRWDQPIKKRKITVYNLAVHGSMVIVSAPGAEDLGSNLALNYTAAVDYTFFSPKRKLCLFIYICICCWQFSPTATRVCMYFIFNKIRSHTLNFRDLHMVDFYWQDSINRN
jgi:hypothetical protein